VSVAGVTARVTKPRTLKTTEYMLAHASIIIVRSEIVPPGRNIVSLNV